MRALTLSLLLTAATLAQPPVPPPPPAAPGKGSVEETILNAQRNHPDIRLAEAKRQMAEAELEQAKLLVAQRVSAAMAKVEAAKAAMAIAQQAVDQARRLFEGKVVSSAEVQAAQNAAMKAKADLAAAEFELFAAKGGAPRNLGTPADPNQDAAVAAGLRWLARSQLAEVATAKAAPAGGVADKLKAILDKPLKIDVKNADFDDALTAVLKAAGEPSLTVKIPMLGKRYLKEPPTATFAGEMTFTAAVQFVLDEINGAQHGVPDALRGKYDIYIREYGLLIARAEDAPKDAPTLTEFAKQVRVENGEKK